MEDIRIHRWNKIIYCKALFYTPTMQQLLLEIDKAFESPLKVLKNDSSSSVALVQCDQRTLVLKRSNTKNWLHFIRRLFLQTRARRNWNFAHQLVGKGIKTLEPIAFIEERMGPFKGRSYLISHYIEGKDLREYFTQPHHNHHYQEVFVNIKKLLQNLAIHRCVHRDLSLGNIILLDKEPCLIDLDSMRLYPFKPLSQRAARKQQQRFIKNCQEMTEISSETLLTLKAIFNEKGSEKFTRQDPLQINLEHA